VQVLRIVRRVRLGGLVVVGWLFVVGWLLVVRVGSLVVVTAPETAGEADAETRGGGDDERSSGWNNIGPWA